MKLDLTKNEIRLLIVGLNAIRKQKETEEWYKVRAKLRCRLNKKLRVNLTKKSKSWDNL